MPRHGIHHRWTTVVDTEHALACQCRRCGVYRVLWRDKPGQYQYLSADRSKTITVHPVTRPGVPKCRTL